MWPVADLRIVAGGDPGGAQALHVIQADAEFDFAIAEHIRIRRAARGVLAQEVTEDPLAVFGGKTYPMQMRCPDASHTRRAS